MLCLASLIGLSVRLDACAIVRWGQQDFQMGPMQRHMFKKKVFKDRVASICLKALQLKV